MYHVDVTHLQAFMYLSVHGAFRYGITAPFQHPRLDPPPPQPQHHLQGIEDCDQVPHRVPPHLQGRLDGSATGNQVQRRRIDKPQLTANKVAVETLGTPECRDGDDTDAQLPDTEQSLSSESDSEALLKSPAERRGASASADTARTKDKAANSHVSQSQNKHLMENKEKEEGGKLKRASKPPAAEEPSQTGIQVTLIWNEI